ncbi:putative L-type lectin-domain containing receptor kinase S.7 [Abeliophyllum distichum]|uniref:L-type lectin-domain containing receptor kinase S.7 n=1 Tax=Abeliophyllum distichum TaxID=126358 RepID=A0ABD1VVJ6_9LAMI
MDFRRFLSTISAIFFSFLIFVVWFSNLVDSSHDNLSSKPVINVTKHLFFHDFSSNNPRSSLDVSLLGSATISNEKGCIQIPDSKVENDLKHLAGRAVYASPIRLFDPVTRTPASFETTFSFQFQNPSNISNSDPLRASNLSFPDGGSGLTFIIVPDEFTVGRPGAWLGMLNDVCDEDYKAVGVEFDARQNPEFGDPNDNHVGINLGSIVSTTAINASDMGIYLKDGLIHRAWISYDGLKKYIGIYLGQDSIERPSKPAYSGNLDLSPYLNEYMFIGFSASTGNHTQIHNILSWNFTSVSQANLRVPSTETCESKIRVQNRENLEASHKKTPTSFLIFLAVVILCLAILLNLYFNGKRKENNKDEIMVLTEKKQRPRPPNKPRKFTRTEISSATRCFGELQILGSDNRSVTYKATMLNGCNTAVKRFSSQFFTSHGLDKRRMHKEIKAISKIRHPNLVPIRGWCLDHQETIVVYDYIPNGSLDKWLFGVGVLPWTRRFRVVKDVAESLSYLHSKELAHKNVKTSSVFLDVSFRAVLGDFGFLLSLIESTRFEALVSQKVDIFEFGVFVLEVVSGRSRNSKLGEMDLLDLAWALHVGDEKVKLVDTNMGLVLNPDQAIRVLEVGLLCTLNDNKGRPNMEQVVEYLNVEKPIPQLPLSRPVSLFLYSSTTGLCSGYSCASFK